MAVTSASPPVSRGGVTAGLTLALPGTLTVRGRGTAALQFRYLTECPTINLAFKRKAFNVVGGFDEAFAYGST